MTSIIAPVAAPTASTPSLYESIQKEHQPNINIFFVYLNEDLQIEEVVEQNHPLSKDPTEGTNQKVFLLKDTVFELIEKNKTLQSKKYRLHEMLQYHIDLEGSDMQLFLSQQKDGQIPLKKIAYVQDIEIPPSIPYFHNMNTVFFLFKEIPQWYSHGHLKPSIKILHDTKAPVKKTKRVKFEIDDHISQNRMTRKQEPHL